MKDMFMYVRQGRVNNTMIQYLRLSMTMMAFGCYIAHYGAAYGAL
jgi:hypothetical protein